MTVTPEIRRHSSTTRRPRISPDTTRRHSTITRRPSQARLHKSINKDKGANKKVTWCPTEATVQQVPNHYDGIDREIIWYSRDELRAVRMCNEFTVAEYTSATSKADWRAAKDVMENEHTSMRGLESWTDDGSWERFQHYTDCLNKVLDEQDRQKGIDKTEFQFSPSPIVKRINHLHIPFDHDRLGALCRDATARARRVAFLRGRRDYLATKQGSKRSLKSSFKRQRPTPAQRPAPVQRKTIQELEERQPQKEPVKPTTNTAAAVADNETMTVQTEASTTAGSTEEVVEGEDSSVASEESKDMEEIPPLPMQVMVPVTAESLQAKHDARFAAYLVNRQHRIDARERADYEWEQRRLARKASIRQEADEHLAKFQHLLDERAELIEMVVAAQQQRRD